MQFTIRRLLSENASYSVHTSSGTPYGMRAPDLKRWLLKLGVGESTIAAVLDIQPTKTATLQVAKAE